MHVKKINAHTGHVNLVNSVKQEFLYSSKLWLFDDQTTYK